jgi:rod shape-determining protein MreB
VKLEAGSASPLAEEVEVEIRGRDLVSGLPKTIVLGSAEVRAALEEPIGHILDAVKDTLDRTPPELAGDIMDRGITLAGGGALLQGLEQRLRDECQMPCQLAESPLTCVAVRALARGVRGDSPREQDELGGGALCVASPLNQPT